MNSMSAEGDIPVLDHALATDELTWVDAVYQDFARRLRATSRVEDGVSRKEVLRQVLGEERHRLPTPMDLSGPGPWRGRNRHGRLVAAVFLPRVELHRHARSRTDQFVMYVEGQADAFSLDQNGEPILAPVTGGAHFHNVPNAPHAFLPKVGADAPGSWEIAFIAITPRNLRDDTQLVSDEVRAAYKRVVGTEAPHDL
jgi:pimeloyl-ACP methyl ester carboxylesterase